MLCLAGSLRLPGWNFETEAVSKILCLALVAGLVNNLALSACSAYAAQTNVVALD
jgi:hypothetical protein